MQYHQYFIISSNIKKSNRKKNKKKLNEVLVLFLEFLFTASFHATVITFLTASFFCASTSIESKYDMGRILKSLALRLGFTRTPTRSQRVLLLLVACDPNSSCSSYFSCVTAMSWP